MSVDLSVCDRIIKQGLVFSRDIRDAFSWSYTLEGWRYWNRIDNSIQTGAGSPLSKEVIDKIQRIRDGYLLGLRKDL